MHKYHAPFVMTVVNTIVLCLSIAFSCGTWAVANTKSQVMERIHAKEILLVDEQENVRAGMMMDKGYPSFFLVDNNNAVRTYWRISKDGPVFCLRDSHKKPRIYLDVNRDDNPSLLVMASNNEPAARLGWSDKDGANLTIKGREGDSAIMLGQVKKGMLLGVTDSHKTARLMLGTQPGGAPLLTLCNTDARPVVALAVYKNNPSVMVQKKPGSRFVASTLPDGEAYVSIARDDAIVWKQPADLGLPAGPILPDDILDGLMDR